MFRRIFPVLLIGLLVGIAGVAAEKVAVRVSGWVSSPVESEIMQTLVDLYNSQFAPPGVEAVYEPIPADYPTKIQTMLAARKAPDVFYWDIFMAEPLMRKGALLPLDDLMAAAGVDPAEFVNTCIGALTYGGKIYGIPKDSNKLALFYNKRSFDIAGAPYPTDDWTWEDLLAAAEAIQAKADEIRKAVPNFQAALCMAPDVARWLPFVFQNGGSFFNADRTAVVINSPEAVEALEFYTGFELEHGVAVRPSEIGAGWQGEAFGKENAAMVMEGGWMVPFLTSNFPDVEFGAVELPAGPAGKGNLLFTVAYVIPAYEKHPAEAFDVLKFLTSPLAQMYVLSRGFALPTRKALGGFITDPISRTIFAGAAYARPWEFGPLGSKPIDELSAAMEAVFLGQKTAQEALDDAAKVLNERLKEVLSG